MGIGNPLVGDEGVGVRVAEALMTAYEFPEGVDVIDAGTMGMGMIGLLRDYEHVVIVDAVDGTGEAPGAIVRLTPEEIAPSQVLHSLHDVKLADVLQAAAFAGVEPDVTFIGIQIESMVTLVTELSPAVEKAIPTAVAEVLEHLERLGVTVAPAGKERADARVIRAIRTRESMRPSGDA